MAKYIKRIRYRRRRVFRTYDFINKSVVKVRVKAPTKPSMELNQSKEEQHITQDVIDDLLQTRQTEVLVTDTDVSDDPEVNDEPLACFEKGQDPYAYLISQLPLMLNSIPNLLHDPNSSEPNEKFEGNELNTENETKAKVPGESVEQLSTNDHGLNKVHKPSLFKVSQFLLKAPELDEPKLSELANSKSLTSPITSPKIAEPIEKKLTKAKPRIICQVKPTCERVLLNNSDKALTLSLNRQQNWLQWRIQAGTQSNLLLARLLPTVTPRTFPWLGLPGHSNRKVRYGGHSPKVIKGRKHNQQASILKGEDDFFHVQVLTLANEEHLTLVELLMNLTPVPNAAHLLASAELSAIARVCLSLPKQSFSRLSAINFMREACKLKQLVPKNNWLDCLHPWLILEQETSVTLASLAEYFNQAPANRIYKVTFAKLSCYVEIGAEQVCLSHHKDKPRLLSKADFFTWLSSSFISDLKEAASLPEHSISADDLVHLLIFQGDDLAKQSLCTGLKSKLAQGLKEWQVKGDIPFSEFVSSADQQSS